MKTKQPSTWSSLDQRPTIMLENWFEWFRLNRFIFRGLGGSVLPSLHLLVMLCLALTFNDLSVPCRWKFLPVSGRESLHFQPSYFPVGDFRRAKRRMFYHTVTELLYAVVCWGRLDKLVPSWVGSWTLSTLDELGWRGRWGRSPRVFWVILNTPSVMSRTATETAEVTRLYSHKTVLAPSLTVHHGS